MLFAMGLPAYVCDRITNQTLIDSRLRIMKRYFIDIVYQWSILLLNYMIGCLIN